MNQNGNGDYTLLWNGVLYRFPTETELWEFVREEEENEKGKEA